MGLVSSQRPFQTEEEYPMSAVYPRLFPALFVALIAYKGMVLFGV